MNLDILDAAVYDNEEQSLTLNTTTAGICGGPAYGTDVASYYWDVVFSHTGQLDIAINFANSEDQAGAEVKVDIDGECATAVTPYSGGSDEYITVLLQSIRLNRSGRVTVKLHITPANVGAGFGHLEFLKLTGPAAVDTEEDMVPREIARVCLEINVDDCELFYTCVTPTLSLLSSCFEVCRFDCGHLNLLDTHYDDGNQKIGVSLYESVDTAVVPNEEQTITTMKAAHGFEDDLLTFPWNLNETYHFIVKAARVEGETAVIHSSFVYINHLHEWKLLTLHKITNKHCLLKNIHQNICSYLMAQSGYFAREAMFGPTWCRFPNGEWKEQTSVLFTEPLDTLFNVDAGVRDNRFFLRSGGRTVQTCKLGSVLTVEATKVLPDILKDIDEKLSVACKCAESETPDDN